MWRSTVFPCNCLRKDSCAACSFADASVPDSVLGTSRIPTSAAWTRAASFRISKRDGLRDLVSGVPVFVHGLDAITESVKRLLNTLASKSRRFGAGYEITLLRDSPFPSTTRQFYVALKLQNRDCFLRIR